MKRMIVLRWHFLNPRSKPKSTWRKCFRPMTTSRASSKCNTQMRFKSWKIATLKSLNLLNIIWLTCTSARLTIWEKEKTRTSAECWSLRMTCVTKPSLMKKYSLSSDNFKKLVTRNSDRWSLMSAPSKIPIQESSIYTKTISFLSRKPSSKMKLLKLRLMYSSQNTTSSKVFLDKETQISKLSLLWLRKDFPIMRWLKKNWIRQLCMLLTMIL